ncbi:class I SAM-dependent RNA methyltransferase [Microlunatus ginsengisoli]|uniref:TRAM domain-containing protein n=1 Tax=Microlunatus ginsengisoli TaxID=363863 RepID=A0ABP6ZNI5_9ACTN
MLVEVEVGPIAHGGHCVARHDGRVIFVRHALPGERVRVEITDPSHARFWRGDAVEVLVPSPDRVVPPCRIAGPGRCGGCDFQHADPTAQRRLKTQVLAEQLERLAGLAWDGEVEAVPGPSGAPDGLGWRTRMRYRVDGSGRAAMRAHRSHELIALPAEGCLIARAGSPDVVEGSWPPGSELVAIAAADGPVLLVDGDPVIGGPLLQERAAGRTWELAADGFWQVHPAAADTLVAAVLDGLRPQPGERAFDLYCGVGLFAGALSGAGCRVWAVESSPGAVESAHRNLADAPVHVRVLTGRVDVRLPRMSERVDLVVLDPPRTGAGKAVITEILRRRPRAVAYVACDPAALARDLGTARGLDYELAGLRAYDLFPMTHHLEAVAILEPSG